MEADITFVVARGIKVRGVTDGFGSIAAGNRGRGRLGIIIVAGAIDIPDASGLCACWERLCFWSFQTDETAKISTSKLVSFLRQSN